MSDGEREMQATEGGNGSVPIIPCTYRNTKTGVVEVTMMSSHSASTGLP